MAMKTKESRIEIRLPIEDKKTIEDAARLANISLSSYILNVVLNQAKLDLKENGIITLNNKERDELMKVLSNPPKPNTALKDLFQ